MHIQLQCNLKPLDSNKNSSHTKKTNLLEKDFISFENLCPIHINGNKKNIKSKSKTLV